jgi:hypothetical protein
MSTKGAGFHLQYAILPSERAVLEFLSLKEGTYRTIAEALAKSLGIAARSHPSTMAVLTRLHGRAHVTRLPHHGWRITKAGKKALVRAHAHDRPQESTTGKIRRIAKRERLQRGDQGTVHVVAMSQADPS